LTQEVALTAFACFRVDVAALGECQAAVMPLVRKFTIAYLEQRWTWPRRFATISEITFLLVDSRAEVLDTDELRELSNNLQAHLFGTGDEGRVALLVFEGAQEAVTAFAAMSKEAVDAAIDDPMLLPPGGKFTRIVPGMGKVQPAPSPRESAEPPSEESRRGPVGPRWTFDTPAPRPPIWEGVQGVYFTPRQIFYADMVTYTPHGSRTRLSLTDGAGHFPPEATEFDAECVGIAVRLLGQRKRGPPLYLSLSFTSLVRPSLRQAYKTLLADLPILRRAELAATIYDVPRDPTLAGLTQARAMLDPHISALDLRTSDPDFEVEKLPQGLVNSVTFVLPDGDRLVRIAALRRFARHLGLYKQRRIWPAISNLRQRAEVDAAVQAQIPFLTGPAICGPRAIPIGGSEFTIERLPPAEGPEGHGSPRELEAATWVD
jgi:hypothetical protein